MANKHRIKHHHNNTLWIVILICTTLIILFSIYRFTGNSSSSSFSDNPDSASPSEKSRVQSCPFECCEIGDYEIKSCQVGYFCSSNNVCEPIDSDNDGLSDAEEQNIGTNPQLYDSDGDTISDYQEVKVKSTNPLNPNSDGDRYNDNLDSDPNTKNTADISVSIVSKEFNIQWVSLGIAIFGGGIVVPSMVIAEPSVNLMLSNQGTDYSSYLGYDIVVYVAGEELKRVHQTAGKINQNYQNNVAIDFEITASEVPSILINSISNENTEWDVRIENLDYEKF